MIRGRYSLLQEKYLQEGKVKPFEKQKVNNDSKKSDGRGNDGSGSNKNKYQRLKAKIKKLEKVVENRDAETGGSNSPNNNDNAGATKATQYDLSKVNEASINMINKLINSSGGRKVANVRTAFT